VVEVGHALRFDHARVVELDGGVLEVGEELDPVAERHRHQADADRVHQPRVDALLAGITESTVTRISFEAEGGGTRMTLVDGPYTEEVRGNAEAGWTDLVANLEALLRS
jgi:hypothetical protein